MYQLEKHDHVFLLTMNNNENRFNPSNVEKILEKIDEVEASSGPASLVITGTGKFFSNGLDLDFLEQTPGSLPFLGNGLERLMKRLMLLPMATIACLNGHAFAGGGIFALAHDFRVMREDRGWFCLPEVDIGIPFTPAMNALLTAQLSPLACRQAMLTGRRLTAQESLELGIIDRAVPQDGLMEQVMAFAAQLANKRGKTMFATKNALYKQVISLCYPFGESTQHPKY